MRDFTSGMHVNPKRQAIGNDDLWWCECYQPLASSNLQLTNDATILAPAANFAGETQLPYYTALVYAAGVSYIFACFANTKNGWIVNAATGAATKIFAGNLSGVAGQTYATPYNNSGFLVIDSGGYFDYGLTAVGTITSWNNSLIGFVKQYSTTVAGGTVLHDTWTGGGTGAILQTQYQVTSVVVNVAGAGYQVGDSLTLTDNNPTTAAQIIVTAVGGGGAITGITLPTGGVYPGTSPGGGAVAVGPTGNVVAGGSGAGATFTVKIQGVSVKIIQPGSGYVGGGLLTDLTAGLVTITTFTISESGVIGGNSVATYAGRVWISGSGVNKHTLYFTDINSYNNFGGAGGTFTINDAYLAQGITALYSANNYLYILGPVSVDVLSNVSISATTGLTSFTRINVLQGIGTIAPMSVSGFNRGLVFLDPSGLYLLAGATPERISDRIAGIIRAGAIPPRISCAVFNLNNEQCLALQVYLVDGGKFTTIGNRSVVFVFERHRWWVYSGAFSNVGSAYSFAGPVCSFPGGNVSSNGASLFAWGFGGASAPQVFSCFTGAASTQGLVMTKLWDGAAAMREKQSINVAIAGSMASSGSAVGTVTVDTELASSASFSMPVAGTVGPPDNYNLSVKYGNEGGGQYIGLTFLPANTLSVIEMIAMRAKTERDMLE